MCGGKSLRMGWSKADLPFGDKTLLEWVVASCLAVTDQCVLVGELSPQLESKLRHEYGERISLIADGRRNLGPLEGIRSGLVELADLVDAVFVSSCDVPLLRTDLISHLFQLLPAGMDGLMPVHGERVYGLTAVYRPRFSNRIAERVEKGQLRVSDLVHWPGIQPLDIKEVYRVDPELDSLINLNTPDDYLKLINRAGLPIPQEIIAQMDPQSKL